MFKERNYGCRMMAFAIHGHQAVSMENQFLRVGILPGWGCLIYEFLDKRTDTDFMMRERRGLSRLNGYEPAKAGPQGAFWDYMVGGWFEMFPNAGKSCEYGGAVYGQHGEVAYQPWSFSVEADEPDRVRLRFAVETMRTDFRLERTMELRGGVPALFIEERVTNHSADAQPFVWGHHFTMGEAFLNENCVIDAPACQVVDRNAQDMPNSQLMHGGEGTLTAMPGKRGEPVDESRVLNGASGVNEMLYLRHLPEGWIAVSDREKRVGIGLAWDNAIFPHAWLWKEFCAGKGFPLYGRCYAMSVEPCVTSVPMLSSAIDAGEAVFLQPGASCTSWLTAAVHHSGAPVVQVERDGSFVFGKEGEEKRN